MIEISIFELLTIHKGGGGGEWRGGGTITAFDRSIGQMFLTIKLAHNCEFT